MLDARDVTRIVNELQTGRCTEHLHKHIGGGVYVDVGLENSKSVNIRHYHRFKDSAEAVPTKIGLTLKFSEWKEFLEFEQAIKALAPEFGAAKPCSEGLDHLNQRGMLECKECSPFVTLEELQQMFY